MILIKNCTVYLFGKDSAGSRIYSCMHAFDVFAHCNPSIFVVVNNTNNTNKKASACSTHLLEQGNMQFLAVLSNWQPLYCCVTDKRVV